MKRNGIGQWLLAAVAVAAFAVAGSFAVAQTDPGRVQGPTPVSGIRHNPFPMGFRAPDGGVVAGRGTAAGAGTFVHDGMCVSVENCVRISASNVNDGGTANIVAGRWYRIKASGSGGDGCIRQGAAVTSCSANGVLPVEAGELFRDAFPANAASVDGGVLDRATLYFLATSSTAMVATLCPVIDCPVPAAGN